MPRFGLASTAIAVLAAIGITTAMDANGLSEFSALPLLPLAALCWRLERLSRQSMGVVWGRPRDYALACAYPVAVLGALVAIAVTAGAAEFSAADWENAARDFALMASATIPVAILTEEGFFRGWLMASLRRRELVDRQVLIWSSIAFALWHVSAVTLDTGFDLPMTQMPVYLVNASIIGAIWGVMRLKSGSIMVASVSHGLWNGGAYVLFGYGQKTGVLGILGTAVFGPENGLLGLALNLAFLAALVRWQRD